MEFKPADPEWLRKQLEGQQDILTAAAERANEYYKSKTCPECGSPTYPVLDTKNPFMADGLTPKCLLQCTYCKTLFEPDTEIRVETGEAYEPLATVADLYVQDLED